MPYCRHLQLVQCNTLSGGPSLTIFKGGATIKAQTIEDSVGASPACCHSERSEESLRGFAFGIYRDREILRFAQNDTRLGVGDCSSGRVARLLF
jgi:hypothetical protein